MLTKEFKEIRMKLQEILDYNNCEVEGVAKPKFSHLKPSENILETFSFDGSSITTAIADNIGNILDVTMNSNDNSINVCCIIYLPKEIVLQKESFREIISMTVKNYCIEGINVNDICVFDSNENNEEPLAVLRCNYNEDIVIEQLIKDEEPKKENLSMLEEFMYALTKNE